MYWNIFIGLDIYYIYFQLKDEAQALGKGLAHPKETMHTEAWWRPTLNNLGSQTLPLELDGLGGLVCMHAF